MKSSPRSRRLLIVVALFGLASAVAAQLTAPSVPIAPTARPVNPNQFQREIDVYLAADKLHPPKRGSILFVGASVFRQWTKLGKQMAPLPVFNRAFGGSRMGDILRYTGSIVVPYAPKIVVYYCGSNDITAGVLPPEIATNFRTFVDRVQAELPQCRIIFVSIIRAPQKEGRWDRVDAANTLIRDYCARDSRLGYIDVNPAVVDPAGMPRLELYLRDQLHYHPSAYVGFTAILKPAITRVWEQVR